MRRVVFSLWMLGLSALGPALTGCNEPPPSAQTLADQHRFEMGCRGQDAQGYERNMPYCGHSGGGH
jgi:hypothetical protein